MQAVMQSMGQAMWIVLAAIAAVAIIALIVILIAIKDKKKKYTALAILVYAVIVVVLFYFEVVWYGRWWAIPIYVIFLVGVPIALVYVTAHPDMLKGSKDKKAQEAPAGVASAERSESAALSVKPSGPAIPAPVPSAEKQAEQKPSTMPVAKPVPVSAASAVKPGVPATSEQTDTSASKPAAPEASKPTPVPAPEPSTPPAPKPAPAVPVKPAATPAVPATSAPVPEPAAETAAPFDSCYDKADKIREMGHPLAAADLYRQSRSLATSEQEKKRAYLAEIRCYVDGGEVEMGQARAADLKAEHELSPVESLKLDAMLTFLKG